MPRDKIGPDFLPERPQGGYDYISSDDIVIMGLEEHPPNRTELQEKYRLKVLYSGVRPPHEKTKYGPGNPSLGAWK